MGERCLLVVHAHPDDESEFAGGTVARYHAEGVRTVLVCCTDGGAGRIRNPKAGQVGSRTGDIVEVRRRELEVAAAIVGFDVVVRLDYPDSGRVGPAELPASSFARLPLEETVRPVVEVVRRERPQVVIAYPDDQRSYVHPDHRRAHEVAVRAFGAASDDGAYPGADPVWQPTKLYYTVTSRERRGEINAAYARMNLPPPFSAEIGLQGRGDPELAPPFERVTSVIDVGPYVAGWIAAMRAHACQMNPDLDALFDIPGDRAARIFGQEEFVLARDLTGRARDGSALESDLFTGVGQPCRE